MMPIISAHVVKDRSLGQFEHRGGQESCWTTSLMVAAPRLPGVQSGTLALAGVPGAQVPAARASSVHSPPQQTRRQTPGVGGSEGAADSGRGGGAGVGGLAHPPSPGRPPRFHLLGLSQPPRGLIRRGCAWRTLNIWIPGRPLPRPAPPGLGRRDPAARASSLRFVREPGNPAFSPPRARPAPWPLSKHHRGLDSL